MESHKALTILDTIGGDDGVPSYLVVGKIVYVSGAIHSLALEVRLDGEATPYVLTLNADGQWLMKEEG